MSGNGIGDRFYFHGSATDPNDDSVNHYYWALMSVPDGSTAVLQNTNTHNPYLDVDAKGEYKVRLVVQDNRGAYSDPVYSTVKVVNQKPSASISITNTDTDANYCYYQLNGGNSHDPDNDPLSYQWLMISMENSGTYSFDNPQQPFTQLKVHKGVGTFTVELVVTDTDGATGTAKISRTCN